MYRSALIHDVNAYKYDILESHLIEHHSAALSEVVCSTGLHSFTWILAYPVDERCSFLRRVSLPTDGWRMLRWWCHKRRYCRLKRSLGARERLRYRHGIRAIVEKSNGCIPR